MKSPRPVPCEACAKRTGKSMPAMSQLLRPSASTRSENTGSLSSSRSTTISWRSSGSSRTPTSKFAAFTNGSPPMLGGADNDTSLSRRPSDGKMVNEVPPAMVRSRPVSAFTRAMISRRM